MYIVTLENHQGEKDRVQALTEEECAEKAQELARKWGKLEPGDYIRTLELEGGEL